MNTSEKQAETSLDNILNECNFNFNHIYYSPNENKTIKHIFSKCSKTGNGAGIPDRIYYNIQNCEDLIIFECKKNDLKKALSDLKHYCCNLIIDRKEIKNIYTVAFVSKELYNIYFVDNNNKFLISDMTLLGLNNILNKTELLKGD